MTANGSGLPGVTLSGCGNGATTNSSGAYSITVSYGTNCTLTPSLTGQTFSPPSATFNNITTSLIQNFTVNTNTYTISGTVTYNSSGLSGVTLSGCGSGAISASDGTYSISVSQGTTCTLTPSLTNYSFTPPSTSFSNLQGNQTGVNFTAGMATYTIGGQITQQANGSPLPNIQVMLNGTEGQSTTTTDSNGNYQFTVKNIGQDRNYHVQPTDPNWGFGNFSVTLANLSGSQPNTNFQSWPMYKISGQVTACGHPRYNVEVDLTYIGVGTTPTYTDQNGNYSFTFPSGGNYAVVPVYQNYSFTSQLFNNLSQNQTASFSIPLPGTCR